MDHRDFYIGIEFSSGGKRWRCTDIGTRVIVGISLEPHEVIEIVSGAGDAARIVETSYISNDPTWHNGPPYAIVEHVFDEDGIEGCSLLPQSRESNDGN